MLNTTVSKLRCPSCGGGLRLHSREKSATAVFEVRSGDLACQSCPAKFPILAGVAILVADVHGYLLEHVKGISKLVPDDAIPAHFLEDYLEAKAELQVEHIEEDLEAERVNALYLMNHYLHVEPGADWWKPREGAPSPWIDELVRKHWNEGPFARISAWVAELAAREGRKAAVELGCGVGGLYRRIRADVSGYLGVDSSFASVALGRHFALGVPYAGAPRVPEDLLQGPVSREVAIPAAPSFDGTADLVVGDLLHPPLAAGEWGLSLVLNAIDMLDEPAELPRLQHGLLAPGGIAIQSCPYIWHEAVAAALRERLPREIRDSARAVEWLYRQAGFEIAERAEHIPWLFLKHVRQLEVYSVHAFVARSAVAKPSSG